jgi:hypothetical protein
MLALQMPGAIIPALGTGLAFVTTRSGVTKRLRPYHPAYCVGTSMTIWLLWTVAASGRKDLLIDMGLLLVALGLVSALPGILSTSVLSVILIGYACVAWLQRGEMNLQERGVISVEVTLLLLTVAATWAGYVESHLKLAQPRKPKKKEVSERNDTD